MEVGVCSSAILISSYKLSMEFTDNVFGTEDFSDNLLLGLGLTWMVVAEKMVNKQLTLQNLGGLQCTLQSN